MSTQQTGGAGEEARLSLYPLLGHIDAEFGTSASQCLDEGHGWAQWPCTGGGQPPMRGVGSGRHWHHQHWAAMPYHRLHLPTQVDHSCHSWHYLRRNCTILADHC